MKRLMNVVAAVLACVCTAIAAEPLVVDRGGATVTGEKLEYNGITVHGDYTIGAGASVTNVGSYLEIGPDAGDNPVMTIKDGGQYTTKETGQSSAKVIRFGQNGGAGKIVVSDTQQRDKSGWYWNNYRFGALAWVVDLAAGASTASDAMDIVQIDTNAFFSVWCVSNRNTQVKARILFNGGTYYQHHRCSVPFRPVPGSEIVLEGINGNPVNIMRMDGQLQDLVVRNPSAILRFCGDCDVVLNGTADSASDVNRPGFQLTSNVMFEQTGDLIVKGFLNLVLVESVRLPNGPGTGDVVLQDAETTLNLYGKTVCVNGLQGVGSIANSSSSSIAVLTVSNADDRLSSELISPSLVWKESAKGYECIKKGLGAMLADSLPSAPHLTIAEGSVRVDGATEESMKAKTVEFKPGTTLYVSNGLYAAENTVFDEPRTSITIGETGVYRVSGDSELRSPLAVPGATIEKVGSGTLTIYDSKTAYPGRIHVAGGTVRLSGRGNTNDWWRFTIRDANGSSQDYIQELSSISLCAEGSIQAIGRNNGMKQATLGTAAVDLKPGEITAPAGTTWTCPASAAAGWQGTLAGLMDEARWHTFTFADVKPDPSNESTWFPVTFRFKSGHAPVDTFRLIVGYPAATACPQAWTLESSPDGVNWVTCQERLGGPTISHVNGLVADACVTNYFSGGSAGLAATSVLRVDDGATLDLGCVAEGQAPCGGLEVDCTKGGGTISRFEPVEGGILRITNFPQGQRLSGFELPLSFGSVVNAGNLSNWTVFVNGVDKGARGIEFRDGKAYVGGKGLMMIVR